MHILTSHVGPKTLVTIAPEAGSIIEDLDIVGEGEARCRPDDLFVPSTGQRIALGRAMIDYGRKLEAVATAESVSQEMRDRVVTAMILQASETMTVFEVTPEPEAENFRCPDPNCGCKVQD